MFENFSIFNFCAWYLVFLFSTTAHEAAHAFAALKMGDDTAHRGGQVSLDPTPHIVREPFGMVIVPILSFLAAGWMIGWASAPYDPEWARRYPKRSGLMALAGPCANFLLMLLAVVVMHIGIKVGVFQLPENFYMMKMVASTQEGFWTAAAAMVSLLFSLNLLLFTFNLLPVPPLDGSGAPLLVLSASAAEKYSNFINSPVLSFVGIFIAWQVFTPIFPAIHGLAIYLFFR